MVIHRDRLVRKDQPASILVWCAERRARCSISSPSLSVAREASFVARPYKSIWPIANSVWSGMKRGKDLCYQLYAIRSYLPRDTASQLSKHSLKMLKQFVQQGRSERSNKNFQACSFTLPRMARMSPPLRASNEALPRARVARAQGTHRGIPLFSASCGYSSEPSPSNCAN